MQNVTLKREYHRYSHKHNFGGSCLIPDMQNVKLQCICICFSKMLLCRYEHTCFPSITNLRICSFQHPRCKRNANETHVGLSEGQKWRVQPFKKKKKRQFSATLWRTFKTPPTPHRCSLPLNTKMIETKEINTAKAKGDAKTVHWTAVMFTHTNLIKSLRTGLNTAAGWINLTETTVLMMI